MEALNQAFEGASMFKDFLDKCNGTKQAAIAKSQNYENRSGDHESRAERLERERFEAKQASRAARGLPQLER